MDHRGCHSYVATNDVHRYGCFQKWWYPTTMGFPTKNGHFWVFWGYHHLRKHPYGGSVVVYVVCSYSYVGLSSAVQCVYVYFLIEMHYSMQHGGTCRWSRIISCGCPEHLPEECEQKYCSWCLQLQVFLCTEQPNGQLFAMYGVVYPDNPTGVALTQVRFVSVCRHLLDWHKNRPSCLYPGYVNTSSLSMKCLKQFRLFLEFFDFPNIIFPWILK